MSPPPSELRTATGAVPLGRPAPGLRMRVGCAEHPDEAGRSEVVVGPEHLSLGYADGEPGNFRRHTDGQCEFHTGDLVEAGPDGSIRFAGRRDQQLKIRGVRIEAADIEAHLRSLEGVADAAVVLPVGRALVVRVTPLPGAQLVGRELISRLARVLAPGAVPDEIQVSGELAASANGKSIREPSTDAPMEPTTNKHLARVQALMAELLGIPTIAADADLFALGGDSLTAIELVLRIEAEFQQDLSIEDIFEHSTAAALSELLTQQVVEPHAR